MIRFKEQENFLAIFKPSGLEFSLKNQKTFNLKKYLESHLGKKFYPLGLLDKNFSGIEILAKSQKERDGFQELALKNKLYYSYYFLISDYKELARIKKNINSEALKLRVDPNANYLKVIKKKNKVLLCRLDSFLSPKKIKTTLNPFLYKHKYKQKSLNSLHLSRVKYSYAGRHYHFHSPMPLEFRCLNLLSNKQYFYFLSEISKRLFLFTKTDLNNSFRLLDERKEGLAIDVYDSVLWFYWYSKGLPNLDERKFINKIIKTLGLKQYKVQLMLDRGQDPEAKQSLNNISDQSWEIKEHGVRILIKKEQGYSPGLFLDQRQNRLWIKNNAKNKKVLNLFSYTSAFSVMAAIGEAREVVSVDSSSATLAWAKENFKLNSLDPNLEEYIFWKGDARKYLNLAMKAKNKFDIIICDPPSFARSKQGIFNLAKDFDFLVSNCVSLLNNDGYFLFSCNYEKWGKEDILNKINSLDLKNIVFKTEILRDLDYKIIDFHKKLPVSSMNSFLIQKKFKV